MTKAKDPKPSRPKRAGPSTAANPTTSSFQISDELWEVLAPLLPLRVNTHPLGGGRPRVPDRTCANGIFYVLRTGCQWKALDATGICSGSTAHLRFQEWVAAGVFLELWRVGLERYDELKGLDWSWLSMDGAMTKSPLGGGKTGANPTDRGKRGVKRSLLTEAQGVPVGLLNRSAKYALTSFDEERIRNVLVHLAWGCIAARHILTNGLLDTGVRGAIMAVPVQLGRAQRRRDTCNVT